MTSPASTLLNRSRVVRALRFARNVLRWGVPARSLLFGPLSLGDDLLCTAVLREARRRGRPFAMMTARPELFAGNSDPVRLLPVDDDYVAGLRRLGAHVIQPYYAGNDPLDPQRDRLPAHHIIAEMCALAGLHGEIAVRPYVHLTDAERAAGRHFPLQIALHSSGLAAAIPNTIKEWGPDRFATLAGQLASHAQLIQLGSPKDPALPVHLDLRGKTTLRQAAAVLSASTVFVGLEGFLGHLARAVDCPSVIVIGGRATAESVGYLANHNLTSSPECAPCNRRSACSYNMKCMAAISPEAVASAAHGLLNRPPARPLVHDTALLP